MCCSVGGKPAEAIIAFRDLPGEKRHDGLYRHDGSTAQSSFTSLSLPARSISTATRPRHYLKILMDSIFGRPTPQRDSRHELIKRIAVPAVILIHDTCFITWRNPVRYGKPARTGL